MTRKLTDYEELLVEMVHYISTTVNGDKGLDVREVKSFLQHKIPHKNNATALECLEKEGRVFLNELIVFMNELED